MSKLDEKKTFIDVLKGLFYILVTAMLGLGSFIFIHYETITNIKLVILVILLILLSYLNIIFATYLLNKIKELKDL